MDRYSSVYAILIFLSFLSVMFSGCTGITSSQDCMQYHGVYDRDYCYMRKASYEYIMGNTSSALQICEDNIEEFQDDCYHMLAMIAAHQEAYNRENDETYAIQIYNLIDICDNIEKDSIMNDCMIEIAGITHMNQSCAYIDESWVLNLFGVDLSEEMCYAKAKGG